MQGELNQARDALQQERENTLSKTDLTALSYATAQPGEIEELNEQKAHLEQVRQCYIKPCILKAKYMFH